MKLSPFQWAKINKEIHSMSDIITAAYTNQALTDDPNDDFGTADLSQKSSVEINNDLLDSLRYLLNTPKGVGFPNLLEGVDKVAHEKLLAKLCTCGAQKTYGPSCSKSFHSSWCDLK